MSSHQHSVDIAIMGMSCASCVAIVEKALNKLPDVESASLNLATERAHINFASDRASEQVKEIAMQHIVELDNKIQALQSMKEELNELTKRCHGNARPNCPILEKLANH